MFNLEGTHLQVVRARSSAGYSVRLIIARSVVRAHSGPPTKKRERHGGLAQLGERLPCKQEVSGSIPLISTIEIRSKHLRRMLKCFDLASRKLEELHLEN